MDATPATLAHEHRSTADIARAYPLRARVLFALAAIAAGVLIAGFWNPRLVDGFGRDVVTAGSIGSSAALASTFAQNGFGFGFLFAAVAGLAATFTACNCVVFAMLPGLAAGEGTGSRRVALSALGVFTGGVVAVGAVYGMFIGFLGPDGIEAFNSRSIRLAQANAIFSALGLVMLGWGAIELGLLERLTRRAAPVTREFFAQPTAKAALLGLLVGAFAIGRPFPVMRDFLEYAAAAESPLYGAAVMTVQGLGQIAVMAALFLLLVYAFGRRLSAWVGARPQQAALVSGLALVAGGAFFVFYWGLAFAFGIGRWGFRLGWY